MLLLRPPLEAYRSDLAAAGRSDPFTDDDAAWLFASEVLARRATAIRRAQRAPRSATVLTEAPDEAECVAALRAALARSGARVGHETIQRPADVEATQGTGRDAGDPAQRLVSLLYPAPPPDVPGAADRASEMRPGAANASAGPAIEDGRTALLEVYDAVTDTAASMEERGAYHLASTLLADFETAAAGLSARQHGLLLAQRARVARKLGAADAAEEWYRAAARVGTRTDDADLVARGTLGRAVLARRRGNYPESRRLYRRALRAAERGRVLDLVGLAHHGLAIAASVAGDVDNALIHGWESLACAKSGTSRYADALGNLAAVAGAAGHHRAALHAYLSLAARSGVARVRLPALGGAAVCAAWLKEDVVATELIETVEGELARAALPYEQAHALVLIAQAWARVQPASGGEPYRTRAVAAATAYGYYELALEAEELSAERGSSDRVVPPDARAVDGAVRGQRGPSSLGLSAAHPAAIHRVAARRVLGALEQMAGARSAQAGPLDRG